MRRFRRLPWMFALAALTAGCDDGGGTQKLLSPEGPGTAPRFTVYPTSSVRVECPTKLDLGTTGPCVAYGTDFPGFLASTSATWSSSNTSVATVSSSGVVTASSSATGSASITGTINGYSGSKTVTVADSNVPPPTVSIGGPGSIKPNQQCYWWANASGGTPPYSYSWSQSNGSGSGFDSEYYGQSSSSFTLYVTVTDAASRTASASKSVTVTSSAFICPL